MGRHSRPSKAASVMAGTTPAAVAGVMVFTGPAAHAQAVVRPAEPATAVVAVAPDAVYKPVTRKSSLPVVHTVVAGDTLAGLAVTHCHGHADDWTGFYHANQKVIGANPNLIYPGQRLNLSQCTDPPALLHLGSTYHAPHHHTQLHATASRAGGKIWGVTYASSYQGRYTYAGLEALWVAAGGPAWAASAAAAVAMCESGGNPNAYNGSGASGLFQILGQVVPGNIFNPYVNALNAVSKFKASGETWAQWVCRP